MKSQYDNAVALLIWIVNNEFIASLLLIAYQAPIKWWLIAQLPVAVLALLITAITAGSQTRGK